MRKVKRIRQSRGQSIIEAAAGGILIVLIALAFVDVLCVVAANMINDSAAKNAARAAADQQDSGKALDAAKNAVQTFSTSPIVEQLNLVKCDHDGDRVLIQTRIKVRLPVKVWGLMDETFITQSVEPVVAVNM